ncbi:MAG: PEP-utilizing enzyme, partial [Gammaproteobacteria bacterium]
GGANSHMAIRCAEFGLPAAIGCGEQIYDRVLHSKLVEINCCEQRIELLEH